MFAGLRKRPLATDLEPAVPDRRQSIRHPEEAVDAARPPRRIALPLSVPYVIINVPRDGEPAHVPIKSLRHHSALKVVPGGVDPGVVLVVELPVDLLRVGDERAESHGHEQRAGPADDHGGVLQRHPPLQHSRGRREAYDTESTSQRSISR